MSKVAVIFILLGFIAFTSTWNTLDNGLISVAKADTVDHNPNGSSELSKLMRNMYEHTVAARQALHQHQTAPFPASFAEIKTAQPTDSATKNQYYNTFADLYLQSLDNYKNSTNKSLDKNYNNLINSCLACHSSHCPGPVPKIKRLLLVPESP